jgi:hypothetical protein
MFMQSATFYRIESQPTSHPILPTMETVFQNNVSHLTHKFLPLVTIDLSKIRSDWNEKVHFIYYDDPDVDQITFAVRGGKYYDMKAKGWNGRYIPEEQIAYPTTPFTEYKPSLNNAFFNLNSYQMDGEKHLFDRVVTKNGCWDDYGETDWEFVSNYDEEVCQLKSRREEKYFGPYPIPIQNGFYGAYNMDGDPMYFIGQMDALDFNLNDCVFYLYYCPKYKLVTQLMQST